MKRSEILQRDKSLFNKQVDNYIEKCESIKDKVKSINNNDIGESEDTLLTNSIYATNIRIGSTLENTISKVKAEREAANSRIDAEIAIAIAQERKELLSQKGIESEV